MFYMFSFVNNVSDSDCGVRAPEPIRSSRHCSFDKSNQFTLRNILVILLYSKCVTIILGVKLSSSLNFVK